MARFSAPISTPFASESEREGRRLLDALDLHWYPFSRRGDLFRTEDAELSGAILDAPRSFDEAGFCEDSWVADALGCRPREGLFLPLLPSLKAIVDDKYPGTGLSFGEFNFGGAGLLASGLAVADALGRFGRSGVSCATHWGSLAGFIGEAYRLYRQPDSDGERFGETALPVAGAGPDLSFFAARSEKSGRAQPCRDQRERTAGRIRSGLGLGPRAGAARRLGVRRRQSFFRAGSGASADGRQCPDPAGAAGARGAALQFGVIAHNPQRDRPSSIPMRGANRSRRCAASPR